MSDARRVAYLVKRFPRLSETFVLGELLEVRRQGLEVDLFALMDPGEATVQPAAAAIRSEVTYLLDPARPGRSWARLLRGALLQALHRPRGLCRVAWAVLSVHRSRPGVRHAVEGLWLAGELRHRGIDHLHAHFAHSPAAVAHAAHLAGGVPFSFTAHAKDLFTTMPRNLRLRAAAARFVVTCTAANATHLESVVGVEPTRLHVIRHGIELGRFTAVARQPDPGRILTVGRLVAKKGHADIAAALEALVPDRDLRWEVYGSGPLRDSLELLTPRLTAAGRAHLHGARVQDEIISAYARAAVFVLAPVVLDDGDRDGIPNVLVEAMACGVPVVATRVSGIPELISDGVDGLLVEPHRPDQLAGAIARLLDDPALARRLTERGLRTVAERFDMRRNSTLLVSLLCHAGDGSAVLGGLAA